MHAGGSEPLEGRYRADGFDAWAVLKGDGILFCVNDVERSWFEGRTVVLCGCMRYK